MKLVFSETSPDYSRYVYPYVVWGFLEAGETPADAFEAGFLPGLPTLERFYLVRQVRVPLAGWKPTSENRRVLRRGADVRHEVLEKAVFPDTAERRERWRRYADERFGAGVMPAARLDGLMGGPVISHLMHFTGADGAELGTALMYLEPPRVAYYYFAFYDAGRVGQGLGMLMMTRAVEHFAREGYAHLYLGTCVTPKARYKLQFEPMGFFNGFRWSSDLAEIRHLLDSGVPATHRLDEPEFLGFQPGTPAELAAASRFRAGGVDGDQTSMSRV